VNLLASLERIYALILRYLYLLQGSWPRVLELAYWPTVQMVLWGLINRFLAEQSAWVAQAAGLFIAAVLLWDVLFRAQLGISVVFLEEMWSRNLGQLFVSPLRPWEWIVALMAISLLRTLIGVGSAAGLAILLYRYSIFEMGLPLLAFGVNLLVMGWAVGLVVSALILRYGLGAEGLAWALIFAIAPISGIYYPVAVLPSWLQPVALALPCTWVFEGMRAVLIAKQFLWSHFFWAVGLNGGYLLLGSGVWVWAFRIARQRNLLLQLGE
jgi:ABC-2 type transport system permease protein